MKFVVVCLCFFLNCCLFSLTLQSLTVPFRALQNDSQCEECLTRVLRQSHAQHVRLVCAANATLCPKINALSQTHWMSWMIFKTMIQGEYVDRRHFCVIVAEKPAQLRAFLGRGRVCYRRKIVIVLPGNSVRNVSRLESLFNRSWKAGIIDVLVVLSDSRCRVFSIVASHEKDAFCDAPKFALTHSWEKSQSCSLNDSTVKYFPEYKISGLNNCKIDVLARLHVYRAWSTLLHFLEFAMDTRFNINTTVGESFPSRTYYPPQIRVANMLLEESDPEDYILSSYIHTEERVYAVPRVLTVSVEWFRILNELSGNVWFALMVISLLSAGTSYLLADDGKDLVYVILFTVQPLFEKSWEGHFLSWRGRMFFTLWLFFCVILTTSYTSTFLSQLTVPSTTCLLYTSDAADE